MGAGGGEVVLGPVEVGGHRGDPGQPVLAADGLDLQDAGDLGDRVGVVGGFQVPGEEVILLQRLRGQLRVDAGGPQEQDPLHPVLQGGVEDVDLDPQVLGQEVHGVGVVGQDPADLRRGQHHVPGLGLREEREHRLAVLEVKLGRGPADEVGEALGLEPAPDRGADQAAVTGHVERGRAIERAGGERRRRVGGLLGGVCCHDAVLRHLAQEARSTVSIQASFSSRAMSASTMRRASSGALTVASQPSLSLALAGSPIRASTSVGRR